MTNLNFYGVDLLVAGSRGRSPDLNTVNGERDRTLMNQEDEEPARYDLLFFSPTVDPP